jgi:peroxiredoxin
VEGIEKFQIVLKSENSFEFLAIIPDAGKKQQAIEEVKSSLNAILDKKEMSNVIFSLSIIDQPIIDKNTRKFKMIMKNY